MSFVKRILSLILALVLVIGLLPVTARAGAHDNGLVHGVCEDHVHVHEYTATVTEPTCTEEGYTTYICACGDSYVTDEVEPLGHDYADGRCSRCFLFGPGNGFLDPSNGRFAPEDVLTRGMLCYALWNYGGCPEPYSTMNPWVDLKESDYYYDAVLWVVEKGITSGISATEFGVDMPVNRAQAATFLWRSFGSPEVPVDNPFTDVPDHTFFHDSALWVCAAGYMAPLDAEDTFKPTDTCLYGHIYWGPGDHTHEYTAVITAPTCTRKGFTTYTCTVCGHRYVSDYVDMLPHEYEAVITDPTCTKKGFTTYTCTVCGHSYAADDVNPLGHDFVDGFCSRCFLYDPNHGEAPFDPGKGMFAPDEVLTRSMFFYALWNYFGSPEPILNVNPFTDISESDYYYDAVLWAVENGINAGITPTQFGPDGTMARFQAALSLWRAFGSPEAPTENPFTDLEEDAIYYEAVLWVCEEGYMSHSYNTSMGYWDTTIFDPKKPCLYGHINWVPTNHPHQYTDVITVPCCTEGGYTTYTCELCGYSYQAKYVDALGHTFVDGTCISCGEADPNPFGDVPTDAWYHAPVLWAVENGITNGTSGDSFSPDDKCLRAHVVTFLWRTFGCPEPSSSACTFTDVTENDFFYKPVLWAVDQEITNGASATEFGSYSNCNRAAVVTFLWRAFGCPEPITTNNPFTDVNEGDFFYKAVLWATESGITNGLTATEFGPTAACNRAQVVTFLYRACSN